MAAWRRRLVLSYLRTLVVLQPAAALLIAFLLLAPRTGSTAWEVQAVAERRVSKAEVEGELAAAAAMDAAGGHVEAAAAYARLEADLAGRGEAFMDLRVRALDGVATARAALGDGEGAVATAKDSIATFSREPSGHRALARGLRATGQVGAAEACLQRALALDPNHLGVVLDLAELLAAGGRWGDVVANHEAYLAAPCRAKPRHGERRGLWALSADQDVGGWRFDPSVDGAAQTIEVQLHAIAPEARLEALVFSLELPAACDELELHAVTASPPRDLREPEGAPLVMTGPWEPTGSGFVVRDAGRLGVTSTSVHVVVPLATPFTRAGFDRLAVRLTLRKHVPDALRALVEEARERRAGGSSR